MLLNVVNYVLLQGRLVKRPAVKISKKDVPYVKFRLANNDNFFWCVAFYQLAFSVSRHVSGDVLMVEGELNHHPLEYGKIKINQYNIVVKKILDAPTK